MDRHLWLGVTLLFAISQGVRCLRDVSLEVLPEVVQRGQEAILRCRYDLQDRPLYSVKWYRGNHEFYRFAPKDSPATKTFPIAGINVDVTNSNGSQVMLRNVDFRLSGNFSCEVTADAPSFSTAFVTKNLNVVSLPQGRPAIATGRDRYDPGDTLEANCTSPPSKPSTHLSFTLNNVPVGQANVKQRKFDSNFDGHQHLATSPGLLGSELSLVLKLLPSHYVNGQLNLRCLAEIPAVYTSMSEVQLGPGQREPIPERANASLKPIGKRLHQRSVKEMELSEVDELLHEMEATEAELAKRISNRSSYQLRQGDVCHPNSISENDVRFKEVNWDQGFNSASPACRLDSNSQCTKLSDPHQNLPTAVTNICMAFDEDSLHFDATDKMIADFKTWRYNCCPTVPQKVEQANNNHKDSMAMSEDLEKQTYARSNSLSNANIDVNKKIIGSDQPTIAVNSDNAHLHASNDRTNSNTAASNLHSDTSKAYTPVHSTHVESGQRQFAQSHRNSYSTGNLLNCTNEDIHVFQNVDATHKMGNDAATNTEFSRKSHRLLTLSDFWESDPSKSQEDMLRIKLEEEKFRRDHCEHLIQELQKRLLEQQEKVAVAVRVDNEKNVVITRLQNAWTKLKLRWQVLEAESSDLHLTLKNVKDKHRTECTELQSQIKRYEGELSKALDLAGGYKEKSDTLTKEKLDLLKSHADELENYKSLVQEVENRYSQLKDEYNKVLDHNQQLGVALKNTQQEVNKERLRGGEVREEMGVIHKALDACEAELIVLRQEKENLQLKLKEETNRNHILEQNKSTLLTAIDEAKMAEKAANAEAKSIAAQQERIRIELREVYQKQVDEVVKAKLQEFQSQLDAAESAFHSELESRQRAIAECAARKIKTVLDKHQLEINLLEEKHKEEKRLYEIQLAQAMQQVSMLNTKLNSQHANKTQLAEQLHSVMQRQWQQALQIISGGNMDNLTPIQRIHAEKFFENKHPMKSESSPNIGSSIMEPMRLESHSMPVIDGRGFLSARLTEERDGYAKSNTLTDNTPLTSRRDQPKDDLRRYIKMILDMQQPKSNFVQAPCSESRQSPTPICREVPRKHYTKKEQSFLSEDSSVVWQPSSEVFTQEESEYVSVPEKPAAKGDQQKNKPPWK
ncbi:paramyosin isoform X1 [Neodiprion pinetum]|uniref:paramyosin isoform X1 n=1 Tax=Neodiprion pinetum TaxID=441929 RepID=UPI001EDE3DF7|nr:cytadherence high molecular weight protein 2-like isoform X1 [Neodiprion pinetum]